MVCRLNHARADVGGGRHGRGWCIPQLCAAWWLLLAVPVPVPAQDAPAADRDIAQIAGDLYQVRDGTHYTVFLVTSEGIVLADPMSRATAEWLRQAFDARFPGRPVRWVLHTSHRYFRAEGASAFAETASLAAHERFNAQLREARRAFPAFIRGLDLNGNGRLESIEILQAPASAMLDGKDVNGDGVITPSELYARVRDVTVTYQRRQTITVGGGQVELVHVPSAHVLDMTVLYFPGERVLFADDMPRLLPAPAAFESWKADDVFSWMDVVLPLDFDQVVTSAGHSIPRAELDAAADYLYTLRAEVRAGYRAGRNLRDLQASAIPAAYSDSPHYGARWAQIEALYQDVQWFGLDLSARAVTHVIAREHTCDGFTACSGGGAVPAATMALGVAFSRRADIISELTMHAQSWSSRTSPFLDEEFAVRYTTAALLLRVRAGVWQGLSFAPVAGVSWRTGDIQGMNRVTHAQPPFGGRHPIADRRSVIGVAGGVDISRPLGDRFGFVVPLRLSRAVQAPPERWPARVDVQVGVGLSTSIVQRLR
jgi:glyoxylase-like metal-dependent hydrolase (beta-lactamase superfamily II)